MYRVRATQNYPHLLDGAIATSAPIWNFYGEVNECLERTRSFPIGIIQIAAGNSCIHSYRVCLYKIKHAITLVQT
jgi:hypothetical protein